MHIRNQPYQPPKQQNLSHPASRINQDEGIQALERVPRLTVTKRDVRPLPMVNDFVQWRLSNKRFSDEGFFGVGLVELGDVVEATFDGFKVVVDGYIAAKKKPIPSMYGIFTYIWLMFMVNVGKYTIHGWYGKWYNEGTGFFWLRRDLDPTWLRWRSSKWWEMSIVFKLM